MRIELLLILSLFWLPTASTWAACSADAGQADSIAPVFFVTDREQRTRKSSLDFGEQINDPMDRTTYGVIEPAGTDGGETGTGKADDARVLPERTYPEFQGLAQDLHSAVLRSERGGFVIFVHGCCVSFREAVRQASRLCRQVNTPVIVYDWGSPYASYSGSLLSCPRSQERFNSFMRSIAQEFPREKIAVVGLSMGNVLIDNFLLQHRPEEVGRTFDQVVFARADMDSIAFRSHVPKIVGHARKVFIYVDNYDPAINLSHLIRVFASPFHHGDRLGRLAIDFSSDQQVQVVDVSPLRLNHDLPCGVVSDLFASDGALPETGQYRYVELSSGLLQAQIK